MTRVHVYRRILSDPLSEIRPVFSFAQMATEAKHPLTLEEKHPHPRDAKAVYLYTFTSDHTRVTDLLKNVFSEFPRAEIAKFIADKKGLTKAESEQYLETKCEASRNKGVTQHKNIEDFYNGIHAPDTVVNLLLNHDPIWEQFREYEFQRDAAILPYRTEWKIYDEDNKLIGTPDLVSIDVNQTTDDCLALVITDWKVVKLVTWNGPLIESGPLRGMCDCNADKFNVQMNIYGDILERKYHDLTWRGKVYPRCKVVRYQIVQFHDTRKKFKIIDGIEVRVVVNELLKLRREAGFKPLVKELWEFEDAGMKRKAAESPLEEGEVRDEPAQEHPPRPAEDAPRDLKRPKPDAAECVERTWSP